jgi:cytoskeletal protein RodZ
MPSQTTGAPAPNSCSSTCTLDLYRTRKQAGLSLEAIAEKTKISLRFLRAIETEEFEKLPGGIFARSYLRQYARAIGYDESDLLAHYARKVSPPAPINGITEVERPPRRLLDRWLGIPTAELNTK